MHTLRIMDMQATLTEGFINNTDIEWIIYIYIYLHFGNTVGCSSPRNKTEIIRIKDVTWFLIDMNWGLTKPTINGCWLKIQIFEMGGNWTTTFNMQGLRPTKTLLAEPARPYVWAIASCWLNVVAPSPPVISWFIAPFTIYCVYQVPKALVIRGMFTNLQ